MTSTSTEPAAQPQATDITTKVSHLTLVVSELAQGRDILEIPTAEGGLILNKDEDDLLEIITEIVADVVPNYYRGNWVAFLMHYMQVLENAAADLREAKKDGEEISETYMIDHLRLFIDKIYEAGRQMVA